VLPKISPLSHYYQPVRLVDRSLLLLFPETMSEWRLSSAGGQAALNQHRPPPGEKNSEISQWQRGLRQRQEMGDMMTE
jgi:hypothetical protein